METLTNLVSICYVVFKRPYSFRMEVGNEGSAERTIYLSKPTRLNLNEEVIEFDNIFEARKFIDQNSSLDFPIEIAS